MHSTLAHCFAYLDHMQEINHLIIMAYPKLIVQRTKRHSYFDLTFFWQIFLFLAL